MLPSSTREDLALSSDAVVHKGDISLTSLYSHFLQTKKAVE